MPGDPGPSLIDKYDKEKMLNNNRTPVPLSMLDR